MFAGCRVIISKCFLKEQFVFSPNQIGTMHVASLTLTGSTDQRCLPFCLLSQGKDVIAEQGEVGEKPSGMCRTDTVTRTDVSLSIRKTQLL